MNTAISTIVIGFYGEALTRLPLTLPPPTHSSLPERKSREYLKQQTCCVESKSLISDMEITSGPALLKHLGSEKPRSRREVRGNSPNCPPKQASSLGFLGRRGFSFCLDVLNGEAFNMWAAAGAAMLGCCMDPRVAHPELQNQLLFTH